VLRQIAPATQAAFCGLALATLLLPGCWVTEIVLWKPTIAPGQGVEVDRVRDVAYYSGDDADDTRHCLDVYIPKGAKKFPVVVLIHGGAWVAGDKCSCGLYSSVGEFLASQGVGVVMPNYRLSPWVKHPEHIRDVARAFAWTRRNVATFGGDPERIFVVGHSAGGHLAALLATDESYLKAEGCSGQDIKGVVCVSGVYHIPDGNMEARLGGSDPDAFRLGTVMPPRGSGTTERGDGPGVPVSLNFYGPMFGDDPEVRAAASPVNHVRPGLPPFVLINASTELPTLTGMTEEFREALTREGCSVSVLRVENRNHSAVMLRAIGPKDPVARAILDLVKKP
jgi:acetyl esterase/lipase